MAKMKPKTMEQLQTFVKNHWNRYTKYFSVGKIRRQQPLPF